MKNNKIERFWELDALRGLAIVLMIVYHAIIISNYFLLIQIDINLWTEYGLQRLTQLLFLLLVGVGIYISYVRNRDQLSDKNLNRKFLFRSIKIFGWGLLISFVSYIFVPEEAVIFGILQLIAMSILFGYLLLKKISNKYWFLCLGIISFVIGYFFSKSQMSNNVFVFLGLKRIDFTSFDYFPLFPWFGWVLVGIFAGFTLYFNNMRRYYLPDLGKNIIVKSILYLGRHSLFIYIIHWPILIILTLVIKTML